MSTREELFNLDPSDRIYVDLYSDESQDSHVDKIFKALSKDIFYIRLRQIISKQYSIENSSEQHSNAQLNRQIHALLEEHGCKELLTTIIAKIYETCVATGLKKSLYTPYLIAARQSYDERLDHLRHARKTWEEGISEELRAIMKESKRPFLLIRENGEHNPFLQPNAMTTNANNSLHTNSNDSVSSDPPPGSSSNAGTNPDGTPVKFLYDSEDLYETFVAIMNSNVKTTSYSARYMGICKLPIHVPDYTTITKRFQELQYSYSQLGMDDLHLPVQPASSGAGGGSGPGGGSNAANTNTGSTSNAATGMKLLQQRQQEAEQILTAGSMLDARRYMRRGVPLSLRNKIWALACGYHQCMATIKEEQNYQQLIYYVSKYDLLTDELYLHDLQTVIDDPRFFVFEEELKEMLLCFSRDSHVFTHAKYVIHAPLLSTLKSIDADIIEEELYHHATTVAISTNTIKTYPANQSVIIPFNGIQPYLGLTIYFAPLCYIYTNKQSTLLYHIARYLYEQLWCQCNVLSSDPGCLLYLCKLFESLLIFAHPKLFLHLVNIGVQPLKIAFPWIQLGFVGLLETEQILHLWERVIGFMDTSLLSVAAVAIFLHRSEMLLRCSSENEANMILNEGSRLHIIPLIQGFLLKDNKFP